jgi:DNA-binding IclR family transcriptional regulator
VVEILRHTQRSVSAEELAARSRHPVAAITTATATLAREGIIERTRSGRLRLPGR